MLVTGGTTTLAPAVISVMPIDPAYKFVESDEDGKFVSNNKDQNNTAALSDFTVSSDSGTEAAWTVSSESYDHLLIYVDDELKLNKSGVESGTLSVDSGEHTVTAVYFKDGSMSSGDDSATIYMDDIKWKTDLSPATVTIDTESKSVSVTLGEGEDQVTVPTSDYSVKYGKEESGATTAFPTAPGDYFAFVYANDDSADYCGSAKSAKFTVVDPDQVAADAVKAEIDELPAADDVTTADKEQIETARTSYDALTDAQKALIDSDTLKKLTDAETALTAAEAEAAKQAADKAAADAVEDKINALPTDVKTTDKEAIEAARTAYDALTDDQKALIDADTLKKLTDAEEALTAAEAEAAKQAADEAAADAVEDKINSLPTDVKTTDKAQIEAARTAYDSLTDDQKALIDADTLKKLTDAETALTAAEAAAAKQAADQAAADTVKDKINALPTDVKTTDKEAIEAARTAYEALTDDQKALIDADTLKKLTDAEEALSKLNNTEPEQVTVGKVKLTDVSSDSYGTLTAKWQNDSYPDGYEVLLWNSGSMGYRTTVSRFNVDGTESDITIDGLIPGGRYFVKVRGYKNIDCKCIYGRFSNTGSATVKRYYYGFGSGFGFGYGYGYGNPWGFGYSMTPFTRSNPWGYGYSYGRPYLAANSYRPIMSPYYFFRF